MAGRRIRIAFIAATVLLAGCEATTSLAVLQPGATLEVKKSTATAVPRTETLTTTSFGNYEFRAEAPGFEPMTGILPLRFNGGYLAADILFFAPAMFFNLREVFPQYEIDLQQRVIRYKDKKDTDWTTYQPSPAEAARGKAHFELQGAKAAQ